MVTRPGGSGKDKHPVTILITLNKYDNPIAMQTLVDQSCTSKGLLWGDVAEMLDRLKIDTSGKSKEFTSIGSKFKVNYHVKLANLMFPCLLNDCTFITNLGVVPKQCST